ncbi:hypothetical protein ACQPZP_06105 [Spirillospora sp. CA-142024]|uniref:hypothetical protein n=1 Tax=Spirillospora sp. CA-142024 TaxID=3240036 RepID=UPI003D944412
MKNLLAEKRHREDQERQQAMAAAGVVKPADVARLPKLIRLLREVSRNRWMGFEEENQVQRLIGATRRRLDDIACVCDRDDPIWGIMDQWRSLLHHDRPRKGRPSFQKLIEGNISLAISLAEQTKSLLGAKCPDWVEDSPQDKAAAAVVQPEDVNYPAVLVMALNKVADSQALSPAREQEIQDLVSLIWGRLQAIAAGEDDDAVFQDVVDQWRTFYQLDLPLHSRKGIRQLVEADVEFAIGLAQATQIILGFKCPTGATGALLQDLLR